MMKKIARKKILRIAKAKPGLDNTNIKDKFMFLEHKGM